VRTLIIRGQSPPRSSFYSLRDCNYLCRLSLASRALLWRTTATSRYKVPQELRADHCGSSCCCSPLTSPRSTHPRRLVWYGRRPGPANFPATPHLSRTVNSVTTESPTGNKPAKSSTRTRTLLALILVAVAGTLTVLYVTHHSISPSTNSSGPASTAVRECAPAFVSFAPARTVTLSTSSSPSFFVVGVGNNTAALCGPLSTTMRKVSPVETYQKCLGKQPVAICATVVVPVSEKKDQKSQSLVALVAVSSQVASLKVTTSSSGGRTSSVVTSGSGARFAEVWLPSRLKAAEVTGLSKTGLVVARVKLLN
jgi:hypothetical protein